MNRVLLAKITLFGVVPIAAVGGFAATIAVQHSSTAQGSHIVAAKPSTPVSNIPPSEIPVAPTPSGSAAPVPSSNSNVVVDAGNQDAIDRFGQDGFDKAVQLADMYVGLSHGDCNRLAGKSDPAVAMDLLFTPDALQKFTDPSAVLWTPPAGMTFPAASCALLSKTTWVARVEGSDDPTLWLSGTAVTTLRPTGAAPFKVTQQISLGLVSVPGDLGWMVNDAHIGKAQTSN